MNRKSLLAIIIYKIAFPIFDAMFFIIRHSGKYFRLVAAKALKAIKGPIFFTNLMNTHYYSTTTVAKPKPFSLWYWKAPEQSPQVDLSDPSYGPVSDFTSWHSLTNKSFSGRHLPPTPKAKKLTDAQIAKLFTRTAKDNTGRSSVFFMFFAQWFTDSFMRIDSSDRRKNKSNHDIDLCQIYGQDEANCRLLRSMVNGKLKCRLAKEHEAATEEEEFLDYLCHEVNGKWEVKPEYEGLYYAKDIDNQLKTFPNASERKEKLYATGLDRGNSNIGYVTISTLFMREHNRICELLIADPKICSDWKKDTDPDYFDERVFQTARMINTVVLLKLVIESYINHISGYRKFELNPYFAERQSWYRSNWITIEFNLLYRWHSLAVDNLVVGEQSILSTFFRFNNGLFEQLGMSNIVSAISTQKAGKITLMNTPYYLLEAEKFSMKMADDFELQGFNSYRKKFNLLPITRWSDLTDDKELLANLQEIYGKDDSNLDKVDYLVGLFAERPDDEEAIFGKLMYHMVAHDAFTHIYSNPLLSKYVYGEATFTQLGMDEIEKTSSLEDFVKRNMKNQDVTVSFGVPQDPPTKAGGSVSNDPAIN